MELDWEREEPRDNVVAGTVGAFLGSLIGVACIVLVNQLGYTGGHHRPDDPHPGGPGIKRI